MKASCRALQVARLKKERDDLDTKHQHTIATLQRKLKEAHLKLSKHRDVAAADAAKAAAAATEALVEPTTRAAQLQKRAAALEAELHTSGARGREAAAAAATAAAAREDAEGRAAAAEAAVAELQAQLASAVRAKEEGVNAARRKADAAARLAEGLREELERVRSDGRALQLEVEGIAVLEAKLETAEQSRCDAQAELETLQGTGPFLLSLACLRITCTVTNR